MSNTLKKIAEGKLHYHKAMAHIPFEEKYKIIVALQKIDLEFRKTKGKKKVKDYFTVWENVGKENC